MKLKGNTLVETLVGTAIILIVFSIAVLTLNRLYLLTFKHNTIRLDNQINKLIYLERNDKLELPYQESFNDWEITLYKNGDSIKIEANNSNNNQEKVILYRK